MRKMLKYLSLFSTLLLALIMFGCEGDKGDTGANGSSFGTLTGKVTDTAAIPHNLAGVTVTPSPAVTGVPNASTDANGNYSLTLPNGNYTLTYSRPGYAPSTQTATVVSTQTKVLPTVALVQTAAAVVNVANAQFGNNTTAKVTATVLVNDPSLQGQAATVTWVDSTTGAVIGTGPSITVHKPNSATQVAQVATFAEVRQSVYPVGFNPIADENGFDVPFFATLDRLQVLPIDQFAFEQAANAPFKAFAQVGASAFNTFSSAFVAASPLNQLPFVPNGGIRNVAVGQPVVLQGSITKADNSTAQSTWNWTVTPPTGSNVSALLDPTTRFPHFIPDAPGTYTITETVSGRAPILVYAAKYVGILNPAANDDPLGIVDTACSNAGCHPGGSASFATPYLNSTVATPIQFFDTTLVNTVFNQWTSSGHRHIMVNGMQLGASYSLNACAKCHSIGWAQYSSAIKSGGFKDIANATGFTDASFLKNSPTFFAGPAGRFDQVLRLSEVQCETCHGPNGAGGAHGQGANDTIGARMSVAADVCGVCHGEPPRHGRYNEWRVSGHGDFQTAMNEGVTGTNAANPIGTGPNLSCCGCHSGQGFPLLIEQLEGTNGNTANPNRTIANRTSGPQNATYLGFLRTNNVQPQTCSTCHLVHNPGRQPGLVGNIVILRGDYQPGGAFDGVTPLLPGGFQANGVGKGALCITCHNSRNGGVGTFEAALVSLHEDGDPSFALVGTPATATPTTPVLGYSAPHEACQGDVLMGHNAYFYGGPEDTHNGLKALPAQLGQRSRHSLLADACVTCHLEKAPPDPTLGYPANIAGAGTNHTFNIVSNPLVPAEDQINNLCSQCHGAFNGVGVQTSFDATFKQALIATGKAVLRIKFGSTAAIPAGTSLTFIPGRTPTVSVNGATPVNLATYLTTAPVALGTANTGAPGSPSFSATGIQLDLAKANWNLSLVAAKYNATQLDGTSYDNGSPIQGSAVQVAGDQSKAVHNPSFANNVLNVTIIRMNQL